MSHEWERHAHRMIGIHALRGSDRRYEVGITGVRRKQFDQPKAERHVCLFFLVALDAASTYGARDGLLLESGKHYFDTGALQRRNIGLVTLYHLGVVRNQVRSERRKVRDGGEIDPLPHS